MTIFVESVDVDAAWEVYYQLADRRHQPGLTLDQLRQVIEAALVGVVEAKESREDVRITYGDGDRAPIALSFSQRPRYRFVSPWVEVDQ